ncbi:MAG: hypothetical protein HQ559_02270 [Lentisphaerae bacterium]|nr:hypothetical protein [Lentisphaerota bacterium]
MKRNWIRVLFVIAALYDGVLGAAFLLCPASPFNYFGVPLPNHMGYVQFPAALLLVFALMYAAVAVNPVRNRNLIPYGMLLKVAYCGVVCAYWLTSGIPDMWKPFALLDIVFLVFFLGAYVQLRNTDAS